MDHSIFIIDDEEDFLDSIRRGLVSAGFKNIKLETNSSKAATFFKSGGTADVALIDVIMPEMDGMSLLELIKRSSPDTECIMVTAVNEARMAVECLRKGAYDYLVKPISKDDLVSAINRALERKKFIEILEVIKKDSLPELKHPEAFSSITTKSAKVIKLLKEAELHAESNVPILITGESGTGKELLAKAIHQVSSRARFPFTPLNMASISGNLFDAEFFGHTKGAFTGAEKDRMGYLEYTNRGTLFMDEIGDLPLEFQGKLLRVLQDGEYIKLGMNKPQKTDIRFVAATNKDLDQLMAKGLFRKDLYYRLKGTWLQLLPLRERKEDIPLLIKKFLEEFCGHHEKIGVDDQAISVLMDFDYPGNIRELKTILQSAVNLAQGHPISVKFLPDYLQKRKPVHKRDSIKTDDPIVPLEEIEKDHILKVYDQTSKNKLQTAKLLGIGLNTLRRKLNSYGIE